MKKSNPLVHWEMVRIDNKAQQYCMKEETRIEGPWEFGTRPIVKQCKDSVEKGREARAQLNKEIAEKGPIQSLEEGLFNYKDYAHVKRSADMIALDRQKATNLPTERGIWIQGPPRIGKSYLARNGFGEAYIKAQNKWWDGYQG